MFVSGFSLAGQLVRWRRLGARLLVLDLERNLGTMVTLHGHLGLLQSLDPASSTIGSLLAKGFLRAPQLARLALLRGAVIGPTLAHLLHSLQSHFLSLSVGGLPTEKLPGELISLVSVRAPAQVRQLLEVVSLGHLQRRWP